MRLKWANHLLVELSWLLVSVIVVLCLHWIFLGLDPYFLLVHLDGDSAVDVPLFGYYVVLSAYFFLFFLTVGASVWLYVIRVAYARFRNRRINLLLKIAIGIHILQLLYVVVHEIWRFSNLREGEWVLFAILGMCIAFWTGSLFFLRKRTRAVFGNSVDSLESWSGMNASNSHDEVPTPFFRLQIELGWILVSMAFAVILMYFFNPGLGPISEDVVITMHDAYFVLSGAEFALYHVLWAWAWVGLLRGIFTRLVLRRVYYFFLVSIGAHLLNLVYFLAVILIYHAASRGQARQITMPMTAYLGTGIAFWVVVLLIGIVRRGAKSAFDPESKPEQ